ncbi:MAG: Trp biosynthesis-associated membrane protein [Nocardioidaceae bacterium]
MAERSRSFGPTVLLGLTAATLAAVAASRDWASASGSAAGVHVAASVKGSSSAPLGVALALVALAAWGTVLVLRGRTRRVVAVLGALASAGVLAAVVSGFHRAQDDAVRAVVAKGGTGGAFPSSLTGWYFVCGGAAVLALTALAVAVAAAARWPAMGSRYDAPATRGAADAARPSEGPVVEQEMWRALDDGRDPTA